MANRHLFGTDGVRGVANEGLTPETAFDLARAAGEGRDGHVVVVTRRVVDSVFDLDQAETAALWQFVRGVGRRMRERLPCARVCVSVIGWAVRHAHVHLIPTDEPGQVPGLEGPELPAARMRELAARLRD